MSDFDNTEDDNIDPNLESPGAVFNSSAPAVQASTPVLDTPSIESSDFESPTGSQRMPGRTRSTNLSPFRRFRSSASPSPGHRPSTRTRGAPGPSSQLGHVSQQSVTTMSDVDEQSMLGRRESINTVSTDEYMAQGHFEDTDDEY